MVGGLLGNSHAALRLGRAKLLGFVCIDARRVPGCYVLLTIGRGWLAPYSLTMRGWGTAVAEVGSEVVDV